MTSAFIRVSKRHPCRVCGHADWCGQLLENESVCICMRVKSERETRNGGYIHRLDNALTFSPSKLFSTYRKTKTTVACDAEQRDGIYATLLREHLILSDEHRNNLRARGLSDEAIEQNGYRSVPSKDYASFVARSLSSLDLNRVPGFYRVNNESQMAVWQPGFYIPVRDQRGKLQALQIRQDEGEPRYMWFSSSTKLGGASSGAPVHFANPHLVKQTNTAIITEGALKADVIAHLDNCAVVGIGGVNAWPEGFARKLKEDLPELKNITIAFDSDWRTNAHVRRAMMRLNLELSSFQVNIRTWPEISKGYDDYLLTSRTTQATYV